MKALIIGTGKIAVQQNIDNENIDTHYKALKKINAEIDFYENSVDSINFIQNNNIKGTFINEIEWGKYDLITISTPAHTHYFYLKQALEHNVPIVICEKPLSNNIEELFQLRDAVKHSKTKVYVNYIRNFCDDVDRIKEQYFIAKNELQHIEIKYQRGFLNNASHAFALIQYLLDTIYIDQISNVDKEQEEIDNDKNLSFRCEINQCKTNVTAFNHIEYNFFEIHFYFKKQNIKFINNVNTIEVYEIENENQSTLYKQNLILTKQYQNVLKDYMWNIYKKVFENKIESNVESIIELSEQLLKIKHKNE